MGDEKHYTVQIKGTAYRFQPLPKDDVERLGMLSNMTVAGTKVFKMLTRLLAASAGPEQWDKITDRYVNGEIGHSEFTTDLFKRLMERQAKDEPAADAE